VAKEGTLHEADVIVYATGFHATEYLYPMTITGRGGRTFEDLWGKDGARAYDQRAHSGYWTEHGRSAAMNPFYAAEMAGFLRKARHRPIHRLNLYRFRLT
jgi:cation diffusion facilitator CzcD-associated flavoprotein CzcO